MSEMLELLEVWFDRTTKAATLLACVGGAVYVAYKSKFVAMDNYSDLAVPAVMALFIVFLLLACFGLFSEQSQSEQEIR